MENSTTPSMLLAWMKDNVGFDQRFQRLIVHDQTFIWNKIWRILQLLACHLHG